MDFVFAFNMPHKYITSLREKKIRRECLYKIDI